MKLVIPQFNTQQELLKFLVENKSSLMAQKMSAIKEADAFQSLDAFTFVNKQTKEIVKAVDEEGVSLIDKDAFTVKAVINTTNIMDSHNDVHMKGIWNKTVKENKNMLHVQEHQSNKFDKIIASGEDLDVSLEKFSWKELGYDMKGDTEALIFTSKVSKERNPYMHGQYAKGYVNNHSVGMRYVKIFMCVNDEKYIQEYENWEKYAPEVVNIKNAEKMGYFWAVTEAKAIEGSAVPLGSNFITPTLSAKSEPSPEDTQKMEAEKSLQERKKFIINL